VPRSRQTAVTGAATLPEVPVETPVWDRRNLLEEPRDSDPQQPDPGARCASEVGVGDSSSSQPDTAYRGESSVTDALPVQPEAADFLPDEGLSPVEPLTPSPVLAIEADPMPGAPQDEESAGEAGAVASGVVPPVDPPEPHWQPHRPAPATFPPRRSSVSDLLATFSVADEPAQGELCRGLKQIAGLDVTPAPTGCLVED